MAKRMREQMKTDSDRSNDSFESVDFKDRNRQSLDVKELHSSKQLFNYLKKEKTLHHYEGENS
jgi:hypothetical protein